MLVQHRQIRFLIRIGVQVTYLNFTCIRIGVHKVIKFNAIEPWFIIDSHNT